MPIVFWASLPPWEYESAAEESSCIGLNTRSALEPLIFRKIQ